MTKPAESADCFLHGFYQLDDNGLGRCPVCGMGTGPMAPKDDTRNTSPTHDPAEPLLRKVKDG